MNNIEKLHEWYRIRRYREFMETHDSEEAWNAIQERISSNNSRKISIGHTSSSRGIFSFGRNWRKWGSIAAMIVVIAGVAVYLNTQHTSPIAQHTSLNLPSIEGGVGGGSHTEITDEGDSRIIRVPLGAGHTEHMADGTHIVMNANTELRYPQHFDVDKREVALTGEAYFEVKHDDNTPFIVSTPAGKIEVLGTHFNVVADAETTVVTLEEGSVRLHFSDRQFMMKPGEQARMHADGTFDVRHVNATNYTSWSTGVYEFNNASLDEITRQLSLWYGVTITIADKSLSDMRFTGVILRSESLETAISTLTTISDLKFDIKGQAINVKEN